MSRRSLTAAVALAAMLLGVGCTQTSSPTSPSLSAFPSVSGTASSVQSASTFAAPIAPCSPQCPSDSPLLAQLKLARNFLIVASKQLDLFLSLPPSGRNSWTGKVAVDSLDNSENALPEYYTPGLTFPVTAQVADALNGIIGVASIALDLLKGNNFPQSPVVDEIKASLVSIISKATVLMNCQKAPCSS